MPVHYLVIFLSLFISLNLHAQKKKQEPQEKKEKKEKQAPENIQTFPKNFLIRPRFAYPLVSVNVSSRLLGKGDKFIYLPAMPGVVGISIKIKKVHISAAVQLPPDQQLERTYGTSKFRNVNLNIFGRVIAWGLFYRDYKGFYLNNYKKYYPEWNQDSLGYPKSPGLRIVEAGINLGFNFNRNFSMNAAFSQGERQKKTAGSFLLGFSERYQRIDSDTSFVPPTQGRFYPNLDKFKYGNFFTTILSAGIGFQFVARKFHFTPVLMAGSGFQVQNYVTDRRRFWLNVPTYASAKVQIGYNGDNFFANLIYTNEFNSIPIKESRIRLFYNTIEAGVGLRF